MPEHRGSECIEKIDALAITNFLVPEATLEIPQALIRGFIKELHSYCKKAPKQQHRKLMVKKLSETQKKQKAWSWTGNKADRWWTLLQVTTIWRWASSKMNPTVDCTWRRKQGRNSHVLFDSDSLRRWRQTQRYRVIQNKASAKMRWCRDYCCC